MSVGAPSMVLACVLAVFALVGWRGGGDRGTPAAGPTTLQCVEGLFQRCGLIEVRR